MLNSFSNSVDTPFSRNKTLSSLQPLELWFDPPQRRQVFVLLVVEVEDEEEDEVDDALDIPGDSIVSERECLYVAECVESSE